MSSWWRIYAETHGITITPGNSWAKIVAAHFGAGAGCSHPKRLALLVQAAGSPGLPVPPSTGVNPDLLAWGWARRLAEDDVNNPLQSSGARMLDINGGRSPLT